MPDQPQLFIGNSFLTTLDLRREPDWKPLQDLARRVRDETDLPRFHPGEFMYMAAVVGERNRITVHLYKHIDTRRYINLDDHGRAYKYQYRLTDPDTMETGGRYRRYRSVLDAIHWLDLDAFETEHLFRSFPPEEWPPEDEVSEAS